MTFTGQLREERHGHAKAVSCCGFRCRNSGKGISFLSILVNGCGGYFVILKNRSTKCHTKCRKLQTGFGAFIFMSYFCFLPEGSNLKNRMTKGKMGKFSSTVGSNNRTLSCSLQSSLLMYRDAKFGLSYSQVCCLCPFNVFLANFREYL